MSDLKKIKQLRDRLEQMLASSKEGLEEFKEKLDQDPTYAMQWADKVFTYAAQHKVAADLLHGLKANTVGEAEFLKRAQEYLTREVLQAARCPGRSTSPSSNHMDEELAAAKARLLELMTSPAFGL